MEKKRILVNGACGRIGKPVTFHLTEDLTAPYEVVAINDIVSIDEAVHEYQSRDATHGDLGWTVVKEDDENIRIGGKTVRVFTRKSPAELPLRDLGISIIEECSGLYDGSEKNVRRGYDPRDFLKSGAERVVMSYPAKIKNVTLVAAVNLDVYDPAKHYLISNGSCTTKAMVGPLKLLLDNGLEINYCEMNTIHGATNSQTVLAQGKKKMTLDNIATHSTGAAQAVAEVIPSLKGKMTGMSYRVPVSDGSIAHMVLNVSYRGELTAEKVNAMFKKGVEEGMYGWSMRLCEDEDIDVKTGILGHQENAIIALSKTVVSPPLHRDELGRSTYVVTIVSGYDNERGPPRDQQRVTWHVAANSHIP